MPDRFGDHNISTFLLLPPALQVTDTSGYLESMCKVLDSELVHADALNEQVANSARIGVVPVEIMNMIWAEYGIDPPSFADEVRQRRVLFQLSEFFAKKGNPLTVRDVILELTGLSCQVTHLWNDECWFRAGVTQSGIHKAGITYRNAIPNTGPHRSGFVAGFAQAGVSPIGCEPVNEHLRMTIELRFTRPITADEERAVNWAIRYFSRAVDIYEIQINTFTRYWVVGQSKVGSGTKVKPCCWTAGISRAGITTVCCDGPPDGPSTAPITSVSSGTWVPWYNGQSVFFPSIP